MTQTEHGLLTGIKNRLKAFWSGFKQLRKKYNGSAANRLSPGKTALIAAAIYAVIAIILLFVPRFIGVADDGSLQSVMQRAGLAYFDDDAAQPAGEWFVRTYQRTEPTITTGISTHVMLIKTAMWLCSAVTQSSTFDVRFLAAIYLTLFLPAFWMFVKQLCRRVEYASERAAISAVTLFLFADVGYIAYFNSLYPEPFWLIGILYCVGLCLSMQQYDDRFDGAKLALIALFGTAAALCEAHCAVIAAVFAVFCLSRTVNTDTAFQKRVVACVSAVVLVGAAALSLFGGATRFDENSKLNAMTSGVLLEASNPADALKEFGIDTRFETLADTSSYSDFPYVLSGNEELLNDFYSGYSTGSIVLYYMRHPSSMTALLELSVRSAFSIRRDYCGNYEMSSGMPARGQTPLFSLASNFKTRSAPKTLGYLLVIAVVYAVLLSGRTESHVIKKSRSAARGTYYSVLVLGLLHMALVVSQSGSAEIARYSLILGICIDILSIMALSEGLHRLNLLETDKEG